MQLEELIDKINKSADDLDFVSTRRYIEDNLSLLGKYRRLLKSNAREILDFLTERLEAGYEPISKHDMAVINAINSYAYKFDVRGIKFLIKDQTTLFLREDIMGYLNKDAETILESMGVIKRKQGDI